MKKTVFFLLFALAASLASATAQNIVLGQRIPEHKVAAWLHGQAPRNAAGLTYVEFFHSSNPACTESLERLRALSGKYGSDLRIVVLTREDEEKVAPLLAPFLSSHIAVGLDAGGRIFSAFRINYVPFGVLVDAKNRALWMGNTLQLTEKIINDSAGSK